MPKIGYATFWKLTLFFKDILRDVADAQASFKSLGETFAQHTDKKKLVIR